MCSRDAAARLARTQAAGLLALRTRQAEALAHLRGLAKDRRLTLLTGTRQPEISEAAVLAAVAAGLNMTAN